jgi:DnaK suppressor protein
MEANMTSTEISRFRQFLSGRASELTAATRRRDAIVIEQSAEELERSFLASVREVAMQNLEGDSVKLREVRAAMRRIDEGTYGICAECQEPISAKRLAAVPAAALCIRCQEALACGCGAGNLRTTLLVAA